MSFVAEASRSMSVTPEAAFDLLANYGAWRGFMPSSFQPVGPADGPLVVGKKLRVQIRGTPAPTTLHVSVVDRAREITWTGGKRPILYAEHRFVFEKDGTGTRVRSIETWHGALTPLIKPILRRMAERVGREQLAGLAHALAS